MWLDWPQIEVEAPLLIHEETPPVSSGIIGVVTDTHGQGTHYQTSNPIPGLYACGQAVASDRVLGVGYQAGGQLMRALIFGFLAAEQAARC